MNYVIKLKQHLLKELRRKEQTEKVSREDHIKVRDDVYNRERRKSDAYMLKCTAENREKALKLLQVQSL